MILGIDTADHVEVHQTRLRHHIDNVKTKKYPDGNPLIAAFEPEMFFGLLI